jgi:hypothetical protein
MIDRELLEMAAKAAGIEALRDPHGILRDCTGLLPENNIFSAPYWNSLADDGDALRLAVACRMQIDILERSIYAMALGGTKVCELDRADIAAAARRAITRAAAEIGKGMP